MFDDQGRFTGVGPLGGSVEFGEELGVQAIVVGGPWGMENLSTHHGAVGHEVLFIAEVAFDAGRWAGQERIQLHVDNGQTCTARWLGLDTLDTPGGPALFPAGLKRLLTQATAVPMNQEP